MQADVLLKNLRRVVLMEEPNESRPWQWSEEVGGGTLYL